MSASVSNSIDVMENPSPIFSVHPCCGWMRVGVILRAKLRGQRHGEAPGVRRAYQLFRVGADWPSSSGLKRIRAVKRAIGQFQPSAAFAKLPCHSASAFRVGIKTPVDLLLWRSTAVVSALPG